MADTCSGAARHVAPGLPAVPRHLQWPAPAAHGEGDLGVGRDARPAGRSSSRELPVVDHLPVPAAVGRAIGCRSCRSPAASASGRPARSPACTSPRRRPGPAASIPAGPPMSNRGPSARGRRRPGISRAPIHSHGMRGEVQRPAAGGPAHFAGNHRSLLSGRDGGSSGRPIEPSGRGLWNRPDAGPRIKRPARVSPMAGRMSPDRRGGAARKSGPRSLRYRAGPGAPPPIPGTPGIGRARGSSGGRSTEIDGAAMDSVDPTEPPSGVVSDPMSAGPAFMLPSLNRY